MPTFLTSFLILYIFIQIPSMNLAHPGMWKIDWVFALFCAHWQFCHSEVFTLLEFYYFDMLILLDIVFYLFLRNRKVISTQYTNIATYEKTMLQSVKLTLLWGQLIQSMAPKRLKLDLLKAEMKGNISRINFQSTSALIWNNK